MKKYTVTLKDYETDSDGVIVRAKETTHDYSFNLEDVVENIKKGMEWFPEEKIHFLEDFNRIIHKAQKDIRTAYNVLCLGSKYPTDPIIHSQYLLLAECYEKIEDMFFEIGNMLGYRTIEETKGELNG